MERRGRSTIERKGGKEMKVSFEIHADGVPAISGEVNLVTLSDVRKLARAMEASAATVRKVFPKLAGAKLGAIRIKCEGKSGSAKRQTEAAAA